MNDIKTQQNMQQNLKVLAAQRVAYERTKNIFGLQILLTVVFAVIFNFMRLMPRERIIDLLPYILSFSVIATLVDLLVFVKLISKMRTDGAKIQEEFDCALYGMTWNNFNSGAKPDKVLINNFYKKYIHDSKRPIENWYDIDLDGLSQEKAILLCQETNLWYDSSLRKKFKNMVLYCLLGMAAISFVISLATKQDIGMMIIHVIFPLMPAIALTIKIYQDNDKSVTASNELKTAVISLKKVNENPSMEDLRKIQDKIYCSRKDGSLVPEWFYLKQRPELEEGMKVNAS